VIQHISAFKYQNDKTWLYSFTEEIPAGGQAHQLSVTIPVLNISKSGLGDLALNYRYQAILTDRFAFSPRVSLVLPTGDHRKGLGHGNIGYQVNLPASFLLSRNIVTHYNIGATVTPSAKSMFDEKQDIIDLNYGMSGIILLTQELNLMVELAGSRSRFKQEQVGSITSHSLFINPGFRYAINCKSGLQIVPGIAAPIGLGPSGGSYGFFAYLSFEHSVRK
jgi:hypothetical protein